MKLFLFVTLFYFAFAAYTCCDNCKSGGVSVLDHSSIAENGDSASILDSVETLLFLPAGQSNPCKKKFVCKTQTCTSTKCRRTTFIDLAPYIVKNPNIRRVFDQVCRKRLYRPSQKLDKFSKKFRKILSIYLGYGEHHFILKMKPRESEYDDQYVNGYLRAIFANRKQRWNVASALFLFKKGIDEFQADLTRRDFPNTWDVSKELSVFEKKQLNATETNAFKEHAELRKNITGKYVPMYNEMVQDLVTFYTKIYETEGLQWCDCGDFTRYYNFWSSPKSDLMKTTNSPPPVEFEYYAPFLATLRNVTETFCKTCQKIAF